MATKNETENSAITTGDQRPSVGALDQMLPWVARTPTDKARARYLVKTGRAKISHRTHETYIGKRGLVNYEAWDIEPAIAKAVGR